VRVDHSKNADSRFYTGSGIYRSVRLRLTNPLAVVHWGTFVTTPQVSETAAMVAVETSVENHQDAAAQFTLRTTILDASGRDVATKSVDAAVEPHATKQLNSEISLQNPALWSVESPALYSLRTEIIRDAAKVDATTTPFGIRTIRFDPNQGFFLNGRNMKLKGVCLHHEAGCLGAAVPLKVLERRLRLMKEIGANAVRTSHNPPAPEFLDLCDRLGLLVQVEAFDEFTPPKNKWVEGRGGPQRRSASPLRLRRNLRRVGRSRHPGHGPPRPQSPVGHHVEHRQ
jgi:beta-galactosidase